MRLLYAAVAPFLIGSVALSCNTVDADECWVNTSGGFGGGGTIPIGAGVGATSSGDFDSPNGETPNPCVASATPSNPDEGGSVAAGEYQKTLLQQELDDQSAGGITCTSPSDCVNKCVAEQKYCWAAYAVHPYKPEQTGELFQCIDRLPPAKAGGSYTCLYRFTSGDVCIFAYGSKLGPFTLPAPPPLCVYKTP